ncbi:MAG: hypothetical protein QF450_04520, partial [Rhodospirillales bacterium]|nr:hypothetical protein [Rhodospirillales bacterium]
MGKKMRRRRKKSAGSPRPSAAAAVNAAAAYPQFAKPLEKRPIAPSGKERIGFLSSHFREHTVAKLFALWVTDLDRGAFEVHALLRRQQGRRRDR